MRDTLHVILAFVLAVIGTTFMMNGQFIHFIIYMPLDTIFIIIPLIIIALIFYKKTMQWLNKINRYSWLIIACYLSGTLSMEYYTYQSGVHFEGFFMTLPLVLAFIYWSQKNNNLLLLTGSKIKKTDGFKIDLFLITTSFVLAGFLSLMMDLNNVDLRGAWPFLIFFISVYGFLFSLIYSLMGLGFIGNHKKYTLSFASFIVLFFSLVRFFPRKVSIFNLMEIEPFYAIPILLLSFNLGVILALHLKNRISKKKNIR